MAKPATPDFDKIIEGKIPPPENHPKPKASNEDLQACFQEIKSVLKKHGCDLVVNPMFTTDSNGRLKVDSRIQVVPQQK